MVRTGQNAWTLATVDAQIAAERQTLDALAAQKLQAWLWLGDVTNLPATPGSEREQILARVGDALQDHPALAAYKGVDEPANPERGGGPVPPAGLVRGHERLKQIDPAHPLVIIQAPLGTVAELTPYRPAFDITGADIYPVSYPPGTHARTANRDISVVGDITKKLVAAAGGKPVWMTLQIAWSGVLPTQQHPDVVPRFPSLPAERFMAYQAIVNGARGLLFFGGHLTQIATPADVAAGWNWTFWRLVLQPLVAELAELGPALLAPAGPPVRSATTGIEVATRKQGNVLYVIAVRRSDGVSRIRFTGLPASARNGEVLFEYVRGAPRTVGVASGSFSDWLALHDARVYRFDV
jgi:hypothetical protein